MTNTEKQQLRSEIESIKVRLVVAETQLSKVEPKQPRRMTLLEWMKLCRETRNFVKIKLANITAIIDVFGVLKTNTIETQYAAAVGSFQSSDFNEYRLTEQWEEVL